MSLPITMSDKLQILEIIRDAGVGLTPREIDAKVGNLRGDFNGSQRRKNRLTSILSALDRDGLTVRNGDIRELSAGGVMFPQPPDGDLSQSDLELPDPGLKISESSHEIVSKPRVKDETLTGLMSEDLERLSRVLPDLTHSGRNSVWDEIRAAWDLAVRDLREQSQEGE